jgi:hypothetical protein
MVLFIKNKSIGAYSSSDEGVVINKLITDVYPKLKELGIKDSEPGFMTFDNLSDSEIKSKLNLLGFDAFLD